MVYCWELRLMRSLWNIFFWIVGCCCGCLVWRIWEVYWRCWDWCLLGWFLIWWIKGILWRWWWVWNCWNIICLCNGMICIIGRICYVGCRWKWIMLLLRICGLFFWKWKWVWWVWWKVCISLWKRNIWYMVYEYCWRILVSWRRWILFFCMFCLICINRDFVKEVFLMMLLFFFY